MILEDLFRNPLHLMTLLVILVVLMGGSRLKDTMGSLGTGIREFKRNIKDDSEPSAVASAPLAMAVSTPSGAAAAMGVSQSTGVARAQLVQAVQCARCSSMNPLGSKLCNQCGFAFS